MDIKLKNKSVAQKWLLSGTTCLISACLFVSQVGASSLATNPTPAPATAPAAPGGAAAPGTPGTATSEYSQVSREYHLKAAFLRYVAQYVEFPAASLTEGMINLCVLGQVPYFEGINSINGKVVNNRAIVVSKIININDAKGHCQIVFIAKTETDKIKDIVNAYKGLPILPFGDMDSFAQEGGAMNFYIANNRLAIMTNLQVIEDAKLKIGPQMLKLVTLVPH